MLIYKFYAHLTFSHIHYILFIWFPNGQSSSVLKTSGFQRSRICTYC